MGISTSNAKDIARIGANIKITENTGYSSDSVKDIIRISAPKGAMVTIHAGKYSGDSLRDFARIGKGNVTIVKGDILYYPCQVKNK